MKSKHCIPCLAILMAVLMFFLVMGRVSLAAGENKPVAEEMIGSSGISFVPKVSYARLVLTVSRPDGSVFEKTFDTGSNPYLDMSGIFGTNGSDGSYTYQLRVVPNLEQQVRKDGENKTGNSWERSSIRQKTLTQTGYFLVRGGMLMAPASQSEDGLSRTMDVLHADDVIIDGSMCVGGDCYTDYEFGYDTIVLMENNLRIFFDDTSTLTGYPANDWRISINSMDSGGGSYFAIEDSTGGATPFKIEAGADSNSLYVDDTGRVGLGTSTPVYELHIADGDTPTIRFDQNDSYGFPAQKWDLAGNEASFFLRDGTNGALLPFRVQPGAPTNALTLKSDGKVGIGTWSPAYPLELEVTGQNATFGLQRTDGAIAKIAAGTNAAQFGSDSNHSVKIMVNNSTTAMTISTSGQVGIGITPTHLIHLNGGAYSDGATWQPACSRMFKENIKGLTLDEAKTALDGLTPVKFNYKANKEEDYIGFIAEDVPELVATKERKSINTMDVVAVLTKIVQDQQKQILEQQDHSRVQQEMIMDLQKRIAELEKK